MIPRRALRNLALLRFPAMLLAMGVMLVVTIGNISAIADGLGMHLFNSARYEEATRMEMELSDLLVKAHRFSYGDRDITRADVNLALDIFWSRVNVVATANYQRALREADIEDAKVAVEIRSGSAITRRRSRNSRRASGPAFARCCR